MHLYKYQNKHCHKELVLPTQFWGDKPLKKVVEDAVGRECLRAAEGYLQLKPWVYGTVTTTALLATCIDVAREQPSEDAQLKVMLTAVSIMNW